MHKNLFPVFLTLLLAAVDAKAIERRGPQFLTEPSYLIFPLPYSIAGIGQGVVVTGLAGNINGTNVDAYALGITGDAEGIMAAVEDIHLLPERLILDVGQQRISKAAVNHYETRGMDSQMEDYKLIEVNKVVTDTAQLTLTLFDRLLELYGAYSRQEAHIIKISDSKGNLITKLDDPYISEQVQHRFGLLVDYTDDRFNPKKGLRFGIEQIASPNSFKNDPDFYTLDKALTLYLPLGKTATWAFHAFQSDAHVTKEGVTDPAVIRQELGFQCMLGDNACLEAEQELVDSFIFARKYGTATALGGENRLRSYPGNRYNGAHTRHFASELRWNLSEAVHPFNFGIWKDIATGLQVALFYETGSVAENVADLGKTTRDSYGTGFRLVSASGYVYRADYATGDEGAEMTIIFSYPW
jgi:hypothetical protein